MSNILIEANNISKIYDPDVYLKRGKNFVALDNVNFVLEKGDFTCIMGPSGSGKSTLLNCLSTLDNVSMGHVLLKGTDMTTLNKEELCEFRYKTLGFVFQDHNLIPYLSIFDNIATPAMLGEQQSKVIKEKVLKIAKDLEIEKLLDKFPSECSGGECQRVAIARALINDPEIIFCDEPTGNLDSKNSHKVLSILSELNKKGTTILLVTHDAMIASYAKTMMYLYDGGIQTVIHRHQSDQVNFFKKINEIVSQDSLLKQFSHVTSPEEINAEITNPIVEEKNLKDDNTIETIKIENTQKEFISRQSVYMYIDGQPYDEQIYDRNTPFRIKGTQAYYRNKHNDEVVIDLSEIQKIKLDLRANFMNFGFFSQFTFHVLIDMVSENGTYMFKAVNKDDMIQVIHYFEKLNILIEDPRQIIESFQKYPRDYERTKFYQRTHKDLQKHGQFDKINPITNKKM